MKRGASRVRPTYPLVSEGAGHWSDGGFRRGFESYRVHSSPLARAVETAGLLGLGTPVLDRPSHGNELGRVGRRVPPPRSQRRMRAESRATRRAGPTSGRRAGRVRAKCRPESSTGRGVSPIHRPGVVAITHKGVIKATMGLARAWNLTGKSPVRLDWSCAHRFRFDPATGTFSLDEAEHPTRTRGIATRDRLRDQLGDRADQYPGGIDPMTDPAAAPRVMIWCSI